MTFQSPADLERYLTTPQGKELILALTNARGILEYEAQRFKQYLQAGIDRYYASYSPTVYKRKDWLKSSLQISSNVEVKADGMQILVYFDDTNVHRWGYSRNRVNTAILINWGWQVKKNVWFKDKEHFGWQLPSNFIERAIEDYYRNNPNGIEITYIFND